MISSNPLFAVYLMLNMVVFPDHLGIKNKQAMVQNVK